MEKDEKFERLIELLRRSVPHLDGTDNIEKNVLNAIRQTQVKVRPERDLLNYLFGWVYIRWMRNVLVGTAVFLVGLFIYQQSLILKRIEQLENLTMPAGSQLVTMKPADPFTITSIDNLTRLRMKTGRIVLDKKQIKELMDSYDEMEHRYKDLIRIIEEDPELKEILIDKLNDSKRNNFNL